MKNIDPIHSYKETQIKTATQGKLIVMLYDGAIKYINRAIENNAKKYKDFDKVSNSIIRAQDIITELMASLDFEKGGEIAKNLFSLYVYINKQLLEANISKDCKPLNQVKQYLMELRSAWVEITNKNQTDQGQAGATGINIAG